MRFQAKTGLGAFVLLLGGALACTQALAQQAPSNNPPQTQPSAQSGPGAAPNEPGPPPSPTPGMQVWTAPAPGRGWAEWRTGGRGNNLRQGIRLGDLGLGNMGIGELNRAFEQAERALRDPDVRQQLGISDDQAQKLEQDVMNFRQTAMQNGANLQMQIVGLRNMLTQQTPDQSAINDQMQRVGDAQQTLEKAAVDFVVMLKQEISPGQQQRIRQFLRERRNRGFGEDRNPPRPGSSSYAGSQPPDGGLYYRQSQPQPYAPQWQNSQSGPEESPAPQPYTPSEPQGSTPMTNNQ